MNSHARSPLSDFRRGIIVCHVLKKLPRYQPLQPINDADPAVDKVKWREREREIERESKSKETHATHQ